MVPAGVLALPLAALAGAAALASGAAGAPPTDAARVELEVAGVLPMPESTAGILVLREKGAQTLLPIIVPDGRTFGDRRHPPAPDALLGETISALGGRVSEVEIEEAEETSAGARVRLAQGGRRIELRAPPSQSIALALAAGAPIVTSRRVLDEAGLTPDDLARAQAKAAAEQHAATHL